MVKNQLIRQKTGSGSLVLSGITLFLAVLFSFGAHAQPFQPDAYGHVNTPAFKKLIKERKYLLVGAFDSIMDRPGLYAALVFKDSATQYFMDIQGREWPVDDPKAVKKDPVSSSSGKKPTWKEYTQMTVKNGTKNATGLKNTLTGKEILPPEYASIDEIYDGHFRVWKYTSETEAKKGLADTSGKLLIPVMYHELDRAFLNGWGICSNDGHYGVLNLQNRFLIPKTYAYLKDMYVPIPSSNRWDRDFRKLDVLLFSNDRLTGLMNLQEKVIVEPIYNNISASNSGLIVIQNKKYGVISFDGTILIPLQDDRISDTRDNGIFRVRGLKQHYLVDLYGNKFFIH